MSRILSKFYSKKDAQNPFKILQQERCPESFQISSARKMPRILSKFFSKKDAQKPFKILQQERCPESLQNSSARKMPRILSKFFSKKDALNPFKILQQERCPESFQNSSARKVCKGRRHIRIWCWVASKSCFHPPPYKKKTKQDERNRGKGMYKV